MLETPNSLLKGKKRHSTAAEAAKLGKKNRLQQFLAAFFRHVRVHQNELESPGN